MNCNKKYISVSELSNRVKNIFDTNFKTIYVNGEVTNLRKSNGNSYFSIKDNTSTIDAIIWKSIDIKNNIKNGDKVKIIGKLSCYSKNSKYQIIVFSITLNGLGDLYEEYIKLKNYFNSIGYFNIENKKILTKQIKRVGILTSLDGAVIKDILYVLEKNLFQGEIYVKNCIVQGSSCAKSVVNGINFFNDFNKTKPLDVLIIARGGGSFDDLIGYSNKEVIESIYNCDIYTISAIGHETDNMLSDFVSDCRAPTPSIAGEIIISHQKNNLLKFNSLCTNIEIIEKSIIKTFDELKYKINKLQNDILYFDINEQFNNKIHKINNYANTLNKYIVDDIDNFNVKINHFKDIISTFNISTYISYELNKLIEFENNIKSCISNDINNYDSKLQKLKQSCDKFDISNNCKNGFILITDKNNNLITKSKQFKKTCDENNTFRLHFNDGYIDIHDCKIK